MQSAERSGITYNIARVIGMDVNPDSGLITNDDDRLTFAFHLLPDFIRIKFTAFEQEVSAIPIGLFCFSHEWSCLTSHRQLSSNKLRPSVFHLLYLSF